MIRCANVSHNDSQQLVLFLGDRIQANRVLQYIEIILRDE